MKKLAALLAFIMLLFAASPCANAVSPGETRADVLRSLREQAAGYAFDCVLAGVIPGEGGVNALPIAKDPLVAEIQTLTEIPASEEEPAHEIVRIALNDETAQAVQALIAAYRNAPYVLYMEPNYFSYIPENRYAVAVTLRLWEEETGKMLPLRSAFAPSDFSDSLVAAVHVSKTAARPYAKDEQVVLDSMEDPAMRELLQSGVPSRLLLLPQTDDPLDAASLALSLIEYEDSNVLTNAQKELIRERVADVRLVTYEGYEEDAAERFLQTAFIRVWVKKGAADDFEKVCSVSLPADIRLIRVVADGENVIFHLDFVNVPAEETLREIAEVLNADDCVRSFRVYRGFEIDAEKGKDAQSAMLFTLAQTVPGDTDGDGSLTAADARLALRTAVGLDTYSWRRKIAADTDGVPGVTAADARMILRAAVGLEKAETLSFVLTPDADGDSLWFGPCYPNGGGYDWTLSIDEAAAEPVVSRTFADTAVPMAAGAGNPSFFEVSFNAPGNYTLCLKLQRVWEDAPVETRILHVTVL